MTLVPVPVHLLPLVWPEVEPWIAGACARGHSEFGSQDLHGVCERGEGVLILIGSAGGEPLAAGVRQIRVHAGGVLSCWILAVGGTQARAWRSTLRIIEADARAKGCATVEFVGRPGWARLLPDYECVREGGRAEYTKRLN